MPGAAACPYVLDGLSGIGGYLTGEPEHFIVDEIPAYAPVGDGEHWYIRIRKRGISTTQVRRLLAAAAGIKDRDIGMAGRKDADAITTQWMSLPVQPVAPDDDRIEILETSRHRNKLRLGHLKGNRFTIRLEGIHPASKDRMEPLIERMKLGIPNYFGPQRFGRDGRGLVRSWEWFESGRGRRSKVDGRFSASVIQSALFNRWLGMRIHDGFFATALLGDVFKKRETGGLFHCTETNVDQQRLDIGEIDPTGPLYGPKMKTALDRAGERENMIREACGLSDSAWTSLGRMAAGGRRVGRIVPQDISYAIHTEEQAAVTLQFTLPPGCYATCVLAELAQNPQGIFARFSST